MLIDLSCPIENHGTIVKTNSETNEPYLLLKLFNISDKVISSVAFQVRAFDSNGVELGSVPVLLENLDAEPKSYFAESKAVSLSGLENAKHFVVDVEHVVFADDPDYTPSEENTVEVDDSEASFDDVLLLRQLASEAVCFSTENSDHWRCVCGRHNFLDALKCVRCSRNKDDVLNKFASRDSLRDAIAKVQEEEELKKAEDEARQEAEKAEKREKNKKICIRSFIALAVVAILAIAGYVTYRAILKNTADKALASGNYLSAYERYEKIGSAKIGETIPFVQGNTPENLMFQSGLFAQDEENLYYLALSNTSYSFSLIKENKISKEKTVLTDAAGGSLNVTKDWIYFVDVEKGHVKRISKDGQNIEAVMETPVDYLSIIGNSMYYIKTDYDNPNNLSEEQCQTLAAQGQMKQFKHLYKMNLEDKKPKQIGEDSMTSCAIYGNKIYYLTESEEEWQAYLLYSMDLDGKNKESVVNSPVASFLIHGDDLYYIRMYQESIKGQAISGGNDLDYRIVRKNLKENTEYALDEQYMVTYLNTNNENLFFIALNREEFIASLTDSNAKQPTQTLYKMDYATGNITQLVTGEVQIFNVVGDELILYIQSQGMCRVKADGTGFEPLLADIASQADENKQEATDSNATVENSAPAENTSAAQ